MNHKTHRFTKANTFTDQQLISLLKAWEQYHGEAPSRRCWNEDATTPSDGIYRKRFGSWGNALKIAGIKIKKPTISPQCRAATIAAHKGKRSCSWKGGKIKDAFGYVLIWMPSHPNAKIGRGKGYVYEHRLVMSHHLGRPLDKLEFVHHRNGIKDDNRIENLELLTKKVHRGVVLCPHCGKEFSIR